LRAEGRSALLRSPGVLARLAALRAEVEARHAPRLAASGFWGRCRVLWQREREWRRLRRDLLPSDATVYNRP